MFPFSSRDFLKLWTTITFIKITTKVKLKLKHTERITHAYSLWLAESYFAVASPAFTLSVCERNAPASRQKPIGSVVSGHIKKNEESENYTANISKQLFDNKFNSMHISRKGK